MCEYEIYLVFDLENESSGVPREVRQVPWRAVFDLNQLVVGVVGGPTPREPEHMIFVSISIIECY